MENGIVLRQDKLKAFNLPKPIRVWGIDLGTTNSTVSEILWPPQSTRDPVPVCNCLELCQPTTEGAFTSPIVPSVVAISPDGRTWVGEGAKRLRIHSQEAGLFPEKTLFFDTKNDMGLKKTYFRAQDGYNAAWKIAGHVLTFLKNGAREVRGAQADRVVVTVPASFQINQRRDTLLGAQMAGFNIKEYDLLEEPTAALLDFLMSHTAETLFSRSTNSHVLVFDFGGGTCDVSIIQIELDRKTQQVRASMLAASRYHRLGGGDLDAAIVHETLIPALVFENGLSAHELTYGQKKKGLEPQLLSTAESLKIALCKETDRLEKFGKYDSSDKKELVVRQPGLECFLGGQPFKLSRPQLSALEWEKILEPFLDGDYLYTRETEYRLTQSVFAPIQDALDRAHLSSKEVDGVLLVGGSTLIPQVRRAIEKFFQGVRVFTFEDPLDVKLAVSRGAAWHAFFLEVTGRPFIQPVVSDTIALLTGKEGVPYTLIPSGASVPYPGDGAFARLTNLGVPSALVQELKMEVIALSNRQPLLTQTWRLNHIVNAEDPITLEFRMGSNYDFECRAFLTNRPEELFQKTVENPLTNVVNPSKVRMEIEELEGELREKGGPSADDRAKLLKLARDHGELKQLEKAQDYLRVALRVLGQPDVEILTLQGIYYGEAGDLERERKAYREADRAAPYWGGAMFNFALSLRAQKKHGEALKAVEKALQKEPYEGAFLTLKGLCLQSLDRAQEAESTFLKASDAFGQVKDLGEWELGWCETCARMLANSKLLEEVQKERKRRQAPEPMKPAPVERPKLMGALQRCGS